MSPVAETPPIAVASSEKPSGNQIVLQALDALLVQLTQGHQHRLSTDEARLLERAYAACGRRIPAP